MKKRKYRLIFLFSLVLAFFLIAAIRVNSYRQEPRNDQESRDYIEVCSNGPVYVPPDTKFVKCNGVVKKVRGFARSMPKSDDCICPRCCDGDCWIIVICDEPEPKKSSSLSDSDNLSDRGDKGGSVSLCYLWISC